MILNMATGTAVKVKAIAVSSAEALPAKKKEGTIAVVTNVKIGNVLIQNETPAQPEAGDVWVNTGASSSVHLPFGNATLYPVGVKQYINGAWEMVPAYVFTSEGWKSLEKYLLQSGNQFTDVTGGWIARTQYGGVAVIDATGLHAAEGTEVSDYNRVAFRTANVIDLSGYRTLRANFTAATASHISSAYVCVGLTANAFAAGNVQDYSDIEYPGGFMSGYAISYDVNGSTITLDYDISAINSSQYAVVYFSATKCSCTSVQLIP